MRKIGRIFIWLVAIVLVVELIGIAIGYASRRIRPHTVLAFRIEGDIPEEPPHNPLVELVAGPPTTVTDIVEALDRARTDPRITGIEVHVSESTLYMAKLQEIRDEIREFNRAGKFSVAYLEFATNRSYYLASACQTVYLLSQSVLYLRGMMAGTMFYRGALDKLGIYPDFYHIGDFKNATNLYTEKQYTPAHREATRALLMDWYHEFLGGVAEARKLSPAEVESVVQKGPLTSQEALTAKLVDGLSYADQARDDVKRKNSGIESRLSLREYLRRTEREGASKIAVIYATGVILPGRSGNDPFGESVMGSETVAEQFRRAREDRSIKAVVLRVNSPGGVAFSSEVIRRELELTRRQKPVVVSMSDVAASGGYWISMTADRIIAEPGTITGSIGIFVGKFNLRKLFDKLGLTTDIVTTAENSTLDWPFQNFTPAQRDAVMKNLRDGYDNFLRGVAQGRHMKVEAVAKIAQGRVWTGERARQLGLVDQLGGLHTAIAAAKELARIPLTEKVGLVFLPPPKSLLERILELAGGTRLFTPAVAVREWLAQRVALARQPVWALLPDVPRPE